MVVIKGEINYLKRVLGTNYIEKLDPFSNVIGYTYESTDDEIKLEFNPDRPDLFSFFALKNAMKCYYDHKYWAGSRFKDSAMAMEIKKSVLKIRPFVFAFVAMGDEISDRLDHLIEYQETVHSVIGKNRKKVSIGIHDLDNISPPFTYDAIDPDKISFETYDSLVKGSARAILRTHPKGIEFSHLLGDLMKVPIILDSENDVMSMPPIINGIKSKITENSKRFFVDITGTDLISTRNSFYLLAYEMMNLGYRIEIVNVPLRKELDTLKEFDGRKIRLVNADVERILGFEMEDTKSIGYLRRMGYRAEPANSGIEVYVPGNRVDVMGAVDVMEDLGKSIGFTQIPELELHLPMAGKPYSRNEAVQIVKEVLVGVGYQEIRSFVVTSQSFYKDLEYVGGLNVKNPKSLDYSIIRDRIYLNGLEFFRRNKRRPLPQKIFEIGEVVEQGLQRTKLCMMIHDPKTSYSSIKQATDYLLNRTLGKQPVVRESDVEGIIPGRGGYLVVDGRDIGIIGEIHPSLLVKFDLQNPVVMVEFSLDNLSFEGMYSY